MTKLDGLSVIEFQGKKAPRMVHYYKNNSSLDVHKFAANLRLWGEAGVVKTHQRTDAKTLDQGVVCMMVGYAK